VTRGRISLRTGLGTGMALAAVYVIVVFTTVANRPGLARPLYDGFVPPSSYQWVKPPPFFSANNVKPKSVETTIALTAAGSAPAGVATPDGQFAIDLGAGAIDPHEDSTHVFVRVTPLAASSLPPLPNGLRGNGNAYRVEMRYEPRNDPIVRLKRPGSLLMEIPEIGRQLYRSTDRATWTPLPAAAIGPNKLTLTTVFDGPGDYLAATNLPELVTAPNGSSKGALTVAVVVGLLATASLVGVALVTRRRMHARRTPGPSNRDS